jgi:hypothetical protein
MRKRSCRPIHVAFVAALLVLGLSQAALPSSRTVLGELFEGAG